MSRKNIIHLVLIFLDLQQYLIQLILLRGKISFIFHSRRNQNTLWLCSYDSNLLTSPIKLTFYFYHIFGFTLHLTLSLLTRVQLNLLLSVLEFIRHFPNLGSSYISTLTLNALQDTVHVTNSLSSLKFNLNDRKGRAFLNSNSNLGSILLLHLLIDHLCSNSK